MRLTGNMYEIIEELRLQPGIFRVRSRAEAAYDLACIYGWVKGEPDAQELAIDSAQWSKLVEETKKENLF